MTQLRNARSILALALLLAFALLAGSALADGHLEPDVTLTVDNRGASDYLLVAVEGVEAAALGAEIGAADPTLTLTVGTRYRIVNDGGAGHPFALLGSDGATLLSQRGDGSFEADEAVAYAEDEAGMTFTLTDELAAALGSYRCVFHPSMTGGFEIAGS